MAHDWLIAELEALREYAALNGLAALAEHLNQARLLALAEIASQPAGADPGEAGEGSGSGDGA